ncbi:MAG: TonB-dependent receptor, partial [Bacteroidales bacterium]|nr:TonB-dependent receptor [Bacteroidales bacterium]
MYPNKELDFGKAHHYVLAYNWRINNNLRLKIEPYYQHLYNIPGVKDSSYSMINFSQDWGFHYALENNSIGRNYGLDITFERFLKNNFYYLVTASVFDSKYRGDDKNARHPF